ncbi:methyltransferase domain-containing protein [Rhizobium sp. C4]|nr:methyltransferase [Rhizobium sp. C4]MCD2173092.1 methyltransferase domain-containing protein [Rhizobium sp. C4]
MDRMYRTQRHIYDLTRKYYLLGRDRAIRELAAEPGQSILELGCGTGRNLALAGAFFPGCRLYGLDISEEMLISARAKLPSDTVLKAGDASAFASEDFGRPGFDRIMISYALSMIPAWEATIDVAVAALNPGGRLHIVDFGQQEQLPGWFRRMLKAWLARFHVDPRAELASAVRAVAERHGCQSEFRPLYRGYAWSACITKPAA